MRLCVVIPHRRRRDLLGRALAAVEGWPVVVVDDTDEGLGALPGAAVVRLGGGQGFAKAANRGLAAAQAAGFTHALLLNDDAAPASGCVEALQAAWGPNVGAVGPVLVDPSGRVESAGMRFSARTGRLRQRTSVPDDVTPVDALSGACLLLDSGVRFHEGFRHGMEDVALCRDLDEQGLSVLLVPWARCAHLGGATVSRRGRAATRHALAGHLRLVGDAPLKRGLVVGYALAQILREGGPVERLAGVWEGWRDVS
ncbi:MAG: glycosyltransferase family 2 protein [Alphaproteobacteria bacterium]|nr:glycosyltransferase family 2 protein [Alphaproteobacteria bacterium]